MGSVELTPGVGVALLGRGDERIIALVSAALRTHGEPGSTSPLAAR
jgi:hypothetical protein